MSEMYSIELNMEKIIAESREVAQALNEFADNLEQIENKYAEPQEKEDKETGHWIEVNTNEYVCSKCGHSFSIIPEDNSIKEYKCCPNCECRMVDPVDII